MQSALCDEGIVVLAGEGAGGVQGGGDAADGLVLGAGVRDALFVDGESLGEEFVGDVFEVCGYWGRGGCVFGGGRGAGALVCDVAGGEEEAEGEFGCCVCGG